MSLYQKFFVKTTKPKKPKKPKNVKYFKNLFYQHLAINKLAPYWPYYSVNVALQMLLVNDVKHC